MEDMSSRHIDRRIRPTHRQHSSCSKTCRSNLKEIHVAKPLPSTKENACVGERDRESRRQPRSKKG